MGSHETFFSSLELIFVDLVRRNRIQSADICDIYMGQLICCIILIVNWC